MDVWVKQLDRGPSTRLTLDGGRNDFPAWTPDGASVTFRSDRASPSFDLCTKRSDGSGEPVLEVDEERAISTFHRQYDVTPDGERFLFIRRVGASQESWLILVQNVLEELKRRVPN